VSQGNGFTNTFNFSFIIPLVAELFVTYVDTNDVEWPLSSSQYSVSGLDNPSGGVVTYPLTGSPIPIGSSLIIQRIVAYQQLTSLVNQSGYYPNVVEQALDNLTMQTQQLAAASQLALTVGQSSTAANLSLPSSSTIRSNNLIGFDASGNVDLYPITSSVGAGDLINEGPFVAGVGFTPGVTTSLVLSRSYGTAANVTVHYDGTYQGVDQYSINGDTITFIAPIPVGVNKVYIVGGTTLSMNVPSEDSIGINQLQASVLNFFAQVSTLSSSIGSTLIGFLQSGIGSVLRTIQLKLLDFPPTPADFGALGNGNDDTFALNKLVTAINLGTFNKMLLDKMYSVTGSLIITQNGIAVLGSGTLGSSGLNQLSATSDTLILQSTNPSSTRLFGALLNNFCIINNNVTPSSGVGLTLNGVNDCNIDNLLIADCFGGIKNLGGAGHNWTNIFITPGSYASNQSGSYCASFQLGADNAVPSEFAISNFDWKGQTVGNINGTQFGLQINCGDGLTFSNGHCGFSYAASLSVSIPSSPGYLDAINFNSVYFDGNYNGTNTSTPVGFQLFGTGNTLVSITFNNCKLINHTLHGASISDISSAGSVSFSNTEMSSNGSYGLVANSTGSMHLSIQGGRTYNNNMANGGSDAISLIGVTDYRIQNVEVFGNNDGNIGFNYPVGINVDSTSSSGIVTGNTFKNCAEPMSIASPFTTTGLNRLLGSTPSVASAAALPSTYLGFDFVLVTGTTNITSISGANIEGMTMTLQSIGILTISTGNNIHLASASNLTTTANTMLTLRNDGTVWREVSRSLG
jgi:hypothetical protein